MRSAAAHSHRARTERITREISQLTQARSLDAERYGPTFAAAWEAATACVLGGKLLRPHLLLDALETLDDQFDEAQATRLAAGIELLHYAFLLHDDVIDGDLVRRGRPNVIGALLGQADQPIVEAGTREEAAAPDALHWAQSNGILLGNLFLSSAHLVFAREPLPVALRTRLLNLLELTITESVVGEQLDVALSDRILPAAYDTVLRMTQLKTATYTFELPLRAAVILAGGTAQTETAVGALAGRLGLAFQLQDDLLSTFGQSLSHGKDTFSDLREGKETLIIAFARTSDLWPRMRGGFGTGALSEADGRRLRDLLTQCGAEAFVRTTVQELLTASATDLAAADTELPAPLVAFLTGFIEEIRERGA